LRAVVLEERFPRLRLSGLDPGDHISRKEGARSVVDGRITGGIQPSVRGQVVADFGLQIDFAMQVAHAAATRSGWVSTRPRTSIFPVTAAEMRAVRRS